MFYSEDQLNIYPETFTVAAVWVNFDQWLFDLFGLLEFNATFEIC